MADDLDDFFQDIEETVKEVVQDEQQGRDGEPDDGHQQPDKSRLVAEEPPTKRLKTANLANRVPVASAPVLRPKGVIVAASSSVVLKHSQKTTQADPSLPQQHEAIPVGPLIPSSTFNANFNDINSSNSNSNNQPPLPQGPVPPLPPPPPPSFPIAHVGDTDTAKNGNNANKTTDESWPKDGFTIFVGNLSRDVTDQQLMDHFVKFASLNKAKVIKDPRGISKGYGFVHFREPLDCAKAIREMDQTWLSSRPIRVKRSMAHHQQQTNAKAVTHPTSTPAGMKGKVNPLLTSKRRKKR